MSRPLASSSLGAVDVTTVDGVLALVRARGGRVTSSRRALLEAIFNAGGHVTADDLAEAVQARMPEVHISTIYRNLDELQRLGVIVHSHLGHGPATYQLASSARSYFICEECGETIEAPDELFRDLARRAKLQLGFSIDPRHFAIFGRCAGCTRGDASDEQRPTAS